MKNKYFIITVDTEGDNLWNYKQGEVIGTRNAEYLPRFQFLCQRYGFKPVYLTNYEMAKSEVFITEANEWLKKKTCEIGIHLHAWNNPPYYNLEAKYTGNSYLIEYPDSVMREKFKVVFDLLQEKFDIKPISHRAGRWATDERYFAILKEFGIKVDCSITPGVNWSSNYGATRGGSDYSLYKNEVTTFNGVVEVPATIINTRFPYRGGLKYRIRTLLFGDKVWLRPASSSLSMMKLVLDNSQKKEIDYVEFMIHSSELMPGGSPYFRNEYDIEQLYENMENLFEYAKKLGYVGSTLKEYLLSHNL